MQNDYYGFKPGTENINTKGMSDEEILKARKCNGGILAIYKEGEIVELLCGGDGNSLLAEIQKQKMIILDQEPRLKFFINARDTAKSKFCYSDAEAHHKSVISHEINIKNAKKQIEILIENAPVILGKKIADLETLLKKAEVELITPTQQRIEILKSEMKQISGKGK